MTRPYAKTDPAVREVVCRLVRRGLVTRQEAAEWAGVPRQLVHHWTADIDLEAARKAALARLWPKPRG